MDRMLDFCQEHCGWNCIRYVGIEKRNGHIWLGLLFDNGRKCFYETDLYSIRQILPDFRDMIKWNEMNAGDKMELFSGHIIDADNSQCSLYAEWLCICLNSIGGKNEQGKHG